MTCDSGPYFCLKNAFTNLFSGAGTNYESCLLTIDGNTVAVFQMLDNNFNVFDSHSRDLHGMPSFSGRCVCYTWVKSIEIHFIFIKQTLSLSDSTISKEALLARTCGSTWSLAQGTLTIYTGYTLPYFKMFMEHGA